MEKRIIVITGASDGIGEQAARQLHALGNTVVIVGRSAEKTERVASSLRAPFYVADFTSLHDVRRLAGELQANLPRIDVLANNAGGIFATRTVTGDGHELTFQVNHLSPFLLTTLLMEQLVASRATVINTSSVAHRAFSHFDIDDLEMTADYSPTRAYGNAKLANILFTTELHRRYHEAGLSAAAFHPGAVASNFASQTNSPMRFIYHGPLAKVLLLPTSKGADTLTWLASTTPGRDWESGRYYVKRKVATVTKEASDPALALQLWERSLAMVTPPTKET